MALYVKRLDTKEIFKVKKYTIDDGTGEESIWCNDWYGRHVIGLHCEWSDGMTDEREKANELLPLVNVSVCAKCGAETKHLKNGLCYGCKMLKG